MKLRLMVVVYVKFNVKSRFSTGDRLKVMNGVRCWLRVRVRGWLS